MGFKKILLPIDGSAHSDTAAEMAIMMAKDSNAVIVLLHARQPVPTGVVEPRAKDLRNTLRSTAEVITERYRTKLEDAGVDHVEIIKSGRVGEVVKSVAKREGCDLIVMGSKGKSDLEGLILGSATHKVLHTTELPVLVVK